MLWSLCAVEYLQSETAVNKILCFLFWFQLFNEIEEEHQLLHIWKTDFHLAFEAFAVQ